MNERMLSEFDQFRGLDWFANSGRSVGPSLDSTVISIDQANETYESLLDFCVILQNSLSRASQRQDKKDSQWNVIMAEARRLASQLETDIWQRCPEGLNADQYTPACVHLISLILLRVSVPHVDLGVYELSLDAIRHAFEKLRLPVGFTDAAPFHCILIV
jgi:hypothetical protein